MVQSTDPGRRSTKKRRGSKLSVRAGLDHGDQHHQQPAQADCQPPEQSTGPDVRDGYLRGPRVGSGG
jgi:hypothetical protein